jgi:GAF domain-containing protein
MSPDERKRQLEGLFSDDVPEPEVMPETSLPTEHSTGAAETELGDPDLLSSRSQDPHEVQAELGQGRVRILNLLLGGAMVGGTVAVLALIPGAIQKPNSIPGIIPFFIGYAVIVAAFLWRRVDPRWRTGAFIGVAYAMAFFSALRNGAESTSPWYLLALPLLFFILIGKRAGILSGVVNVLLYIALALANRSGWVRVQSAIDLVNNPAQFWVLSATFALISGIIVVIQWLYVREQQRIQQSLQEQGTALREEQAQSRVRQQELEAANELLRRQATHFELSVRVGRVAAMGLELDEFTERATDLIHERLAMYYVGLFLLDEERAYATLQASAGGGARPGRLPSAPSLPRLALDGEPLLRQCVSSGQARITSHIDRTQDVDRGHAAALFLQPETRSAIALPMVAYGRIFGVITVQSTEAAAFRDQDAITLRAVADQVSTAISNAQLSEELRSRVSEMETLQRYYVREAWEQFLPTRGRTLYEYEQPDVAALGDRPLPEVDHVLADPKLTILDQGEASAHSALVSPISLRDQVLGVLGLHRVDPDQPWTEDQIELVAAISNQMGLIIENSRLFEEAQLRAGRERRVREITARMRQSMDVEMVLQTAVREMGEALRLHDVTIQFSGERETVAKG